MNFDVSERGILEFFCNPIAPVVERDDGIAFRKEIADKPLAHQEAFRSGRRDRHDLVLLRSADLPEMEIIGDLLLMIGMDVEIFSLLADSGSKL